jgi:protein SCO1
MRRALLMLVALLCVAGGLAVLVLARQWGQPPVEALVLTPAPRGDAPPAPRAKKDVPAGWLDQFTLTERSGRALASEDLDGKVWAASFFFADCPGECHQQNMAIAQIQREFGPQGVTFVSITCNPERDTPERLREYARTYTKSADEWLFLTGDLTYIRRVGGEFFGVAVDKNTHGSRLILVDKWGNIRGYYSTNGARNPQEYAAIRPKLRELLAEREPPEEFQPEGAQGDYFHPNETEATAPPATAPNEPTPTEPTPTDDAPPAPAVATEPDQD